MNQYLAVTSNGMENLLVEELTKLGIENAKPVQAGVKFKATNEQIYRCCLWSRLASRFVRVLSEFTCNDDMDLYLSTSSINWVNQFHSSKRFVVDFNGTNREIRNSQYGAMKVKDGIVDCFEKKGLPRPNISKERPDIRVHVRLHKDKAILGVDMVGSGLHQRGYRPESGRAPLRETLAAAIIMRCGWDGHQPLLDPMCGSGTLLIEAAMMAANMAPGVKRKQWCFESLEDFEPLPCHQKNYSIAERSADEVKGADTNTQIAPDFSNRLKKNIGKIGKWARKEKLDCYRIYDADLPEYNVAIDVYGDQIVIQEYAAPKNIPEEKAKRRLTDIIRATIQVTGVEANKVVLKVREKQKGRSQYQKLGQVSETLEVNEYGVKLIVNLHDYLDTGLFLDHKITRRRLGEMAQGKDFLNLFAYTGSATVHAAVGGARSTTTVDMSNTYLNWAKDNMQLNGCIGRQHRFEQADCLQWLENAKGEYDLIFIDPPTFSNSKRMETSFDVQRDHIKLMTNLKRLLRAGGTIVFSNNKRHFKMDEEGLAELGLKAQNISSQTLPLDFSRNKHIHNCWLVTHAE